MASRRFSTTNLSSLLLVVFCILSIVRCKSVKDPNDDTDVSEFQCGEGKFKCSSQKCIPVLWQCDGDDDCGDGSDEVRCAPATCRPDIEFTCRNKKCIPSRWACDKENDCSDGSDEDSCPKPTCKPNFFQCNNSRCIPEKWRCDGQDDCGDSSDENTCQVPQSTCKVNEFQCADRTCIFKQWICDGENDCADGTDEKNCTQVNTCSTDQFACSTVNRCIPNKWHCDGTKDCPDGTDEKNCTLFTTKSPLKTCGPNFWRCGNGNCIKKEWQCDGQADCSDGSDEQECSKVLCPSHKFSCTNGRECIFKSLQCDGNNDCDDGSDELQCEPVEPKCGADHFNCSDGTCIDQSKVCDLTNNCPNAEDEPLNCFINECRSFNGHCMHTCNDKKVGYECTCNAGYKLSSDKHSCEDIDECSVYGMCHQLCENTKGSYKCACADGYLLEPNRKSCKAIGAVGWVYFANRHDIRRISADRSEFTVSIGNLSGVMSFDFHTSQNKIFWADIVTETIHSATIDQPETRNVIMDNVHTPDGLVVDWVGGKLYWTDTGYKTIEVADIDGKHNMDLVSVDLAEPRAIALNPHAGHVYWTDWGEYAAIERISMDGALSTRKKLITENIVWPNGLTLDLAQKRMYWIDAKLSRVESADLNGNHRVVIKHMGIAHPFALDNFEDMLYWTDWRWDGVKSMSKFNTTVTKTLQSGLYAPMDVKVMHPSRQKYETNPCGNDNNGCSHLCLLANHYGHRTVVCKCPRGMILDSAKKNCIGTPVTRSPKSKSTYFTTKITETTTPTTTMTQSTREKMTTPSKVDTTTTTSTSSKKTSTKKKTTVSPEVIAGKNKSASSGMGTGAIAAIAISIIIGIILLIIFAIFIRRRNSGKGHVMFYKDMSTTPLEDDFDIHEDDKAKIISED